MDIYAIYMSIYVSPILQIAIASVDIPDKQLLLHPPQILPNLIILHLVTNRTQLPHDVKDLVQVAPFHAYNIVIYILMKRLSTKSFLQATFLKILRGKCNMRSKKWANA